MPAKMSQAEREALAARLDEELDRFIDDLAAKRRAEPQAPAKPFDLDEWCKGLDEHPAFMTQLKERDGGGYSEAVQAIQAMMEDDEEEREAKAKAAEKLRQIRQKLAGKWAREDEEVVH